MFKRLSKQFKLRCIGTTVCAVLFATAAAASFRYHVLPSYDAELRAFSIEQVRAVKYRIAEREQAAAYAEYAERFAELDADREVLRERWSQVIRKLNVPPRAIRFPIHPDERVAAAEGSDGSHWSFRDLRSPSVPKVVGYEWPRNAIDQFILAGLEKAGLEPAPPADGRTLIRRLSFDLLGVPPGDAASSLRTGEFLSDDAYAELVDSMLDDPAFGEHWARYWLDLARYADSNGYEEDEIREEAYPYRDFVIWAMNHDLPYDQFVRWQIAGDQLEPSHPLAVAATGFCTAGPINTFMPRPIERMDELDDIVGTTFSATLGLSVRCARCHDHMYDPITSREYYQLVSVFKETRRDKAFLVEDQGRAYREYYDPLKARYDELKEIRYRSLKESRIAALEDFTEAERDILRQPLDPENAEQIRLLSQCKRCLLIKDYMLTDDIEPLPVDLERHDELVCEIASLEADLPPSPPVGLVLAGGDLTKTPVLGGGLLSRAGEMVGPGFLRAVSLHHDGWDDDAWTAWQTDDAALPRTALACWLTDHRDGAGNLLARVIVNRLWQWHFGRGLVSTPSDFGLMGDEPTHPELLEWLAGELIANNWSLKHIHRLILNSSTYRQSAYGSETSFDRDPLNQLVGRYPVRRLTAEMIRDAALCVGGATTSQMYGAGVRLPYPESAIYTGDMDKVEWPTESPYTRPATRRRTIYALHRRTSPNPFLAAFDSPDAGFPCEQRAETIVPTQSLTLLNSLELQSYGDLCAERLLRDCGARSFDPTGLESIIQRAYRLSFGRSPSAGELSLGIHFLRNAWADPSESVSVGKQGDFFEVLSDYCHTLFLTNEFIYYN